MNQKVLNSIIISGLLSVSTLSAFPQAVSAQYAPEQPQPRTFLVNKTVLDPRNNKFVDNLTVEQFKFLPNQDVWYRVEFKNVTGSELTNVVGKDVLPAGMQLVSGDGVYDPASNTLTVNIDKIAANSSRFWDIKARFVSGKGGVMTVGCVNNYAEGRRGGEMMADYSKVCVSDKLMGEVSELPRTGPASTLVLLGSLAAGVFGISRMFRKAA